MTLPAGMRLGAYEVLTPLGAGGMGEVYRARDTRLGREVAIKVLPAAVASDPERLKRFAKEARAASALNHPVIVTVYDIGDTDGVSWIAMELVEGKTLRELLVSGALPLKRVLQVGASVAEGLARAHEAGVVHRDLKPENVMVSRDGLVKVLDFGLAKLTSTLSGSGEGSQLPTMTETTPGVVVGTVGYMSPEQASGEAQDFRSDQFALGSILYEMTTGRRAFQRKTAVDTLAAILNDEPESIASIKPQTPAPLRWVVERCLAKDPEDRYVATRDLARDLSTLRDRISETGSGEAVAAAPRPRRRLRALAIGLTLMAAAATAVWSARGRLSAPPSAPQFTRLTFRQGAVGYARFAPDGQTIVYGATWAGEPPGVRLYRTQLGSPEYGRFDFAGDILAISPSNELAILQNGEGSDGTLARVQMSGGTPRQLLEGVNYAGADFSPDGKELAVSHSVEPGKHRLEFPVGNVLAAAKHAHGPRFSRDGRLIAFWEQVDEDDTVAISVIGRDGKGKRVLSEGWLNFHGVPCWSADGREVWFTANEHPGRPAALWAVDLSGKRRIVMRVPGDLELDDVSKDGRALFLHIMYSGSLRFASASDPSERELSWLDRSIVADLSADGRTVLLNEDGEGAGAGTVIYLRGTDGAPAVRLGEGQGWALSPDGKWVLAKIPPAGAKPATLFLLPTGPGQPTELAREDFTDYAWGAFLPDSKKVVYSAVAKDGSAHAYVQAVSGGKPQAIGPDGFSLLEFSNPVSPDGKYLVGLRDGKALLVSLDGTGPDRVLPGLSPSAERILQWSKDARYLYASRARERPRKVWLYELATGQRRLWKEFPYDVGVDGIGVRMTPAGDAWTIVSRRTSTQLYLVEGLR